MVSEVDVAVDLDVEIAPGLREALALRALLVDACEEGKEVTGM